MTICTDIRVAGSPIPLRVWPPVCMFQVIRSLMVSVTVPRSPQLATPPHMDLFLHVWRGDDFRAVKYNPSLVDANMVVFQRRLANWTSIHLRCINTRPFLYIQPIRFV